MAGFTIYERSALCFRAFGTLVSKLQSPVKTDYLDQMPLRKIEEEHGRFKIWLGNLGALQRGHASLDYRVRESDVMKEAILKLLSQLNSNLDESILVVSGSRVPFELLDPDWSSDEESEAGLDAPPRFELRQRLSSIGDILASLYLLSFKLRNSSTRPNNSKAIFCTKIDEETGIDLFSQLHRYDHLHIQELLRHTDQPPIEAQGRNREALIDRLANANTSRRRQFHYWRKHSSKLSHTSRDVDDKKSHDDHRSSRKGKAPDDPEQAMRAAHAKHIRPESTPSVMAQTIFSGTEATTYDKELDELETQSVISYATTTYDSEGKSVNLPMPPSGATESSGFICPYCMILCPPRHGIGRAWRAHLFHDLQPYVCTYTDCSDRLYSSRRQWLEHEGSTHRKVWRCFECSAVFKGPGFYRSHLMSTHALKEELVDDLIDTAETYLLDDRDTCPLCFEKTTPGPTFHHHLAHHLETIACFAFPRDIDTEANESNGGSNTPQARSEESEVRSEKSGALSAHSQFSLVSAPIRETAEDQDWKKTDLNDLSASPDAELYTLHNEGNNDVDSDDDLFAVRPRRTDTMATKEEDKTNTGSRSTNSDVLPFKWTEGALLGNGTWSKSSSALAMNLDTGDLMVVKKVQFSDRNEDLTAKDGRLRMRQHLITHLIDIVKDLKHENVVRYLGSQLDKNTYSLFMEYVPGGSLSSCLEKYGHFQSSLVATCMKHVISGLVFLHSHGILHRELKTEKIFIDNQGFCKIGWSFRMDKVDDAYGPGSKDAVLGTTFWLAPEVVRSNGLNYSGKSDVWSLGGIVLELFSGDKTSSKKQLFENLTELGPIPQAPTIPDSVAARMDALALSFVYYCFVDDPNERPTAGSLLRSPFLEVDAEHESDGTMFPMDMSPKSEYQVADNPSGGTEEDNSIEPTDAK